MASIRFTDIEKTFVGGIHAVHGVDLEIVDREFMVLVGPSGCGKTTLLRMIAGLEDPTKGEIKIDDTVVNDLEPKDRDIAMVFQSYALYPHMNVRDNMSYSLKVRNVARADRDAMVKEAAQMLGIESLLDRLPRELSGGQRQRVALGRAIVRKPRVFLFDEPLSNLDAKMRAETRVDLRQLMGRLKATAVFVTHDQAEAMTLGDRVTVMNKGEVQQVGTPLTIYRHPWNLFVAQFIGTPPMNFLRGKLNADGNHMDLGGTVIPLRMSHRDALAGVDGREAILGARPEQIRIGRMDGQVPLEARVEAVEHMGDHQVAYLAMPSSAKRVLVKAGPADKLVPGRSVEISIDTSVCAVFDGPQDEARNLTLPNGFAQRQ